jgi:hypothetical protein
MVMACFRFLHQKKSDCLNNCDFSTISFVESKEFYEIHPCIKRRLVWKYSVARELENDNRISDTVVYHC